MPRSIALLTSVGASAERGTTPKAAVPTQTRDTRIPDRPRRTYCTEIPPPIPEDKRGKLAGGAILPPGVGQSCDESRSRSLDPRHLFRLASAGIGHVLADHLRFLLRLLLGVGHPIQVGVDAVLFQ